MQKTLIDLAKYLKSIIPDIEENYDVDPRFEKIADQEEIRNGIVAFRQFLIRLYDNLIVQGEDYYTSPKVAHEYENRTTLSVYYPFLHNVKTILMRIGLHGNLIDHSQSLSCDESMFDKKLSGSRTMECIKFLINCGLIIEGVDLTDKKIDLSNTGGIKVFFPSDPRMLIGLKVMAIAEVELGTLDNQDAFMRCDYRILKSETTDIISILKDAMKFCSKDVQNLILHIHHRYLDKGLKCVVEIKGYWIFFKYTYKRKELFGFNMSLNNGFQINVKAENTSQYAENIKKYPLIIQEEISKGYGCGRKRFGQCDGGCRGLILPIDDSILKIKHDIENWLDLEMFYR